MLGWLRVRAKSFGRGAGGSKDLENEIDNEAESSASSPQSKSVRQAQELVVGMDMNAGGSYAITYFGLNVQFDEDANWKLVCNNLKKSMREPMEGISVIYWGRSGVWLSVEKPILYKVPSGPALPSTHWTYKTHKQFSPLFREVVFAFLLVSLRLKLPCEQAMLVLEYLPDFVQLSPSPATSISLAVEPCDPYPSHEFKLTTAEGSVSSLYVAKFGLGFNATLVPINREARDSLAINQPEVIRSDT